MANVEKTENLYVAEMCLTVYKNSEHKTINLIEKGKFYAIVRKVSTRYDDIFTGKRYFKFHDFNFDQLESTFINSYMCATLYPIEKFLDNPRDCVLKSELIDIVNKINGNTFGFDIEFPSDPFLCLIYLDYIKLDDYSISENDKKEIVNKLYSLAEKYVATLNDNNKEENNKSDLFNIRRLFVMELSQIENNIASYIDVNSQSLQSELLQLKNKFKENN